jgi:beta-glucosidase
VSITNTGERTGSEVVRVYVAPADHVVPRPEKELAGFAKLTLAPGETGVARVQLKERSFARWDVETHVRTIVNLSL